MADDAFARLVRNAGSVTAVGDSAPIFSGSVNGRQPYPLDQWNPSNCGFVDIAIDRDGRWFHEGSEIKRVELVSLFAGLLRREDDGAYYLVTPVEKVEVDVAWTLRASMIQRQGRAASALSSTQAVFSTSMTRQD